jgi:hypothetical protein
MHVMLWLPITIWGLIEWSRMHMSLRQVEQAEYDDETASADEPTERFSSNRPTASASFDS